jgi:hypothetical protein
MPPYGGREARHCSERVCGVPLRDRVLQAMLAQ